jgi:hypothetical protein
VIVSSGPFAVASPDVQRVPLATLGRVNVDGSGVELPTTDAGADVAAPGAEVDGFPAEPGAVPPPHLATRIATIAIRIGRSTLVADMTASLLDRDDAPIETTNFRSQDGSSLR